MVIVQRELNWSASALQIYLDGQKKPDGAHESAEDKHFCADGRFSEQIQIQDIRPQIVGGVKLGKVRHLQCKRIGTQDSIVMSDQRD